jgi:hypothetical protein
VSILPPSVHKAVKVDFASPGFMIGAAVGGIGAWRAHIGTSWDAVIPSKGKVIGMALTAGALGLVTQDAWNYTAPHGGPTNAAKAAGVAFGATALGATALGAWNGHLMAKELQRQGPDAAATVKADALKYAKAGLLFGAAAAVAVGVGELIAGKLHHSAASKEPGSPTPATGG